MIINDDTITKYVKGIANPNTSKTYGYSLKKFINYLDKEGITDVNQDNIQKIIHDYKADLNNKNLKAIQ